MALRALWRVYCLSFLQMARMFSLHTLSVVLKRFMLSWVQVHGLISAYSASGGSVASCVSFGRVHNTGNAACMV